MDSLINLCAKLFILSSLLQLLISRKIRLEVVFGFAADLNPVILALVAVIVAAFDLQTF